MASKTATRTRKKTDGPKADPYKLVTEKILAALDAGVVPWHKPWRVGDGPRSLSTGKLYTGVNVWTLAGTALVAGYDSPWWGTYRQISERGGQVRKGEKGTPVVFWKFIEKTDPISGKVTDRIPFLRYFSVFNADQCDDLVVPSAEEREPVEPIAACERISNGFLTHSGPTLQHGGDAAYYSPTLDTVQMPRFGQFETADHYYGTLFHEYGHSTGVEGRLNRSGFASGRFGSPDYSREELVAEMTAAFVCAEAGIDVNVPHHAAYIDNWRRKLGDDPKLIVQAGGQAQKAANLILGRTFAPEAATEGGES